jgi:hypothetical protein
LLNSRVHCVTPSHTVFDGAMAPDLNDESEACMLDCVALMLDMIERKHCRGRTARRAAGGVCKQAGWKK